MSSADGACGSEVPLVAKRCEKRDHGGLEHGAPMFLSLGDDGPATAIRFCRFFANVDFDGVEEKGKRVEISERHGDFLIGLDTAQPNLQSNPEWGLIVTRRGRYTFGKTTQTKTRNRTKSNANHTIQKKN